eukprot:scaffold46115_cov66-Phaeocystis_antarctica.AAC.9
MRLGQCCLRKARLDVDSAKSARARLALPACGVHGLRCSLGERAECPGGSDVESRPASPDARR